MTTPKGKIAMADANDIRRGLAGVVADTTAVSSVNPDTNSLLYRGYPVQELAATQSFEAVAWLLWHGDLPTADERAAFEAQERAERALTPTVRHVIDLHPTSAHPMDVLRSAVSVFGAADLSGGEAGDGFDGDQRRAERLFAMLPAVIAYDQRRRHGLDPIEPRDDLGYAANLLWMTFGEEKSDVELRAFEVSLILYAEHSFNASTFTARVIASTTSDLFSAVVGAIGALKGPLHGGANEAVMHTLDEIGSADRVSAWVDAARSEKRKIMGFGHRVYKNGDSRVPTMEAALLELFEAHRADELAELYRALADDVTGRTGIHPNLDYPSGPTYRLLGFDTLTFTPLFVAARVTGWTAHIHEQRESGALIRPLSAYVGPEERHVTPPNVA